MLHSLFFCVSFSFSAFSLRSWVRSHLCALAVFFSDTFYSCYSFSSRAYFLFNRHSFIVFFLNNYYCKFVLLHAVSVVLSFVQLTHVLFFLIFCVWARSRFSLFYFFLLFLCYFPLLVCFFSLLLSYLSNTFTLRLVLCYFFMTPCM